MNVNTVPMAPTNVDMVPLVCFIVGPIQKRTRVDLDECRRHRCCESNKCVSGKRHCSVFRLACLM